MDVFWFRIAKSRTEKAGLRGNIERGRLLVMIDRGDYWQCAFLIPKGVAEAFQAKGIEAIRGEVAAANILAGPLARGAGVDPLLAKVQQRRLLPTRLIQAGQKAAQNNVIGRLLQPGAPITKAPLLVRLLDRFPVLRRIPGRIIGLGIRRERVRSPEAARRP